MLPPVSKLACYALCLDPFQVCGILEVLLLDCWLYCITNSAGFPSCKLVLANILGNPFSCYQLASLEIAINSKSVLE